jgi:EAL domain-containing protein (putative c-di-GMP-specific phosphodiesterase class I)
VDLRSRVIVGYEALMRVSQPDGRVLTAGQLQPALLNLDVSRQVALRMAALVAAEFALLAKITQAKIAPKTGKSAMYVSLNATAHNLLHDNFAPALLQTLDQHGIAPSNITLEVTETMLITDLERASAVLHALKAKGVSIALDDFGTGFSSLTHLNKFPIDKVKIDRSFVMDIVQDRNARSIVAAVIAMARSLSIDVIAEGIEDEAQLAILRQMGCPLGQGYLLGRPYGLSSYLAKSLNHAAEQQVPRGAQT